MPEQTQIVHSPVAAAPNDYTVADNVEFKLVAVNANFADNGAGSDWLPAVVLLSDSGHVIARALLPDVKVTAGDDAEVSFFPGVKPGGGGAATLPQLNQSHLTQSRSAVQTITSGVVTTIGWDGFQSLPGYGSMFGPTPGLSNPVTFVKFATVVITLTVVWPAAAYDRYCELAVGSASTDSQISSPRLRDSLSPDGDRQTLTAAIAGDPFNPTTITARVFQASGVNRNITAGINYYSIPYGVAPYVLP